MNSRHLAPASCVLVCVSLAACSSQNSYDHDAQSPNDAALYVDHQSEPVDEQAVRTSPALLGFDLPVTVGSYWEIERRETFAGRTTVATYRMTLSGETSIRGVRAFAVTAEQLTGDTVSNLGTHWRYLSFEGQKIMGSEDGVTLRPIFDAWTGSWPSYGGFWNQFRGGPMVPTRTTWRGRNGWSLYQDGGNECIYIPGYGRVCGESDPSQSFHTTETFAEHIGPVKCVFHGCASGGCIDVVYELITYSVGGATTSCGDRMCSSGETCATCSQDCGLCECARCNGGATCGAGLTCAPRRCDGAAACFASGTSASCATVGGTSTCPSHALFEACAADSDCQTATFRGASCLRLTGNALRCAQPCTRAADCTLSPDAAFDSATPVCMGGACLFPCQGASRTCPLDLRCGDGNRWGFAGVCS